MIHATAYLIFSPEKWGKNTNTVTLKLLNGKSTVITQLYLLAMSGWIT